MPHQNRVTPFGEIAALPGRGEMLGNRGVLVNDERRIVRLWQVRRWIACRLQWRGIRRTLMTPRRWTELFFLDEAAAFAAGHRPCAECRNADFKRFRGLWEQCFGAPARADDMDRVLHAQRLDRKRGKQTYRAALASLPDGTYVVIEGAAFILWHGRLAAWSDAGYTHRRALPADGQVDVLTPRAVVDVFRAGYVPAIHPSL